MKRIPSYPRAIALALGLLVFGVSACFQQAPATETEPAANETARPAARADTKPSQQGDIRVGLILPYTGIAAQVGPDVEKGVQYALDEVGGAIAGRKIRLMKEDETDDPATAVAKAKKLVEQDKVDVVVGPLLASNSLAVGAYLAPLSVPHMAMGAADAPTSKDSFYAISGRGDAYPAGYFAYDDLGGRTAALMYMDYVYGQQNRDGFVAAFTEKGGKILYNQAIPFGTSDMAPFLQAVGKADVLAVFLVNPTDFAFVRQYRELGLKMPVMFISNSPQEEPLLAQMGDDVLGMYGSSWYGPLIDSPSNKKFVETYRQKFGANPGTTADDAYQMAAVYFAGLKATGGDADYSKVIDAMKGIKDLDGPAGPITVTPGRIIIHDVYIFKAAKVDNRYAWQVVKKYPTVQPK